MTTQATQERDLVAEKLEAEIKESEAQLKILQARTEARKAKEDMDRISGLTAAKERIKKQIGDMKRQAGETYAARKREAEEGIKAFKADLQRLSERYTAWDEARERQFNARLDEADAKLKVWKAQAQERRAKEGMKRHDDLATLEEKIALAKARAAEARQARHSAEADAALEDAAHHFDQAYEAAAKRYTKK
jgi:phage shock protein A